MSHPDVAAVVLAAGKGTRLKSDTAKVLHRVAGRSLLGHVMTALRSLGLGQVVVVVGHQAGEVTAEAERVHGAAQETGGGSPDTVAPELTTVVQEDQLGTGNAAEVALRVLDDDIQRVLVLPGDTPLLTPEALDGLLVSGAPASQDSATAGSGLPTAVMLTTEPDDPTGYGRVLRDQSGGVAEIVEEADADADQRAVPEVNGGVYAFDRTALAGALPAVDRDNAQDERYLTDVVGVLATRGETVSARPAEPELVLGVNDRAQLAAAGAELRARRLRELMVEVGVTVVDPAATYIDVTVEVGRDSVIHPGSRLRGDTRVGEEVEVGPDADLTDTEVADGAVVRHAVCDQAVIGTGATVGPYTHLRAGSRLRAGAKVGAFAETKNATVGRDAKVPHLAYVGDAELGAAVNFSCGAVTVNYDGFAKHRTVVEDGAFVGCDTLLVAPVTVGAGAFTAAGSTITEDVPADALAIARSHQEIKEAWAARRRAREEGGDSGG